MTRRGVAGLLLALAAPVQAHGQTPLRQPAPPSFGQSPFGQAAPPVAASPLAPAPQYRPPSYQVAPPAQPNTPPSASTAPPSRPDAPATAAAPPNTWVPQGTAVLQALDKVNAQSATLSVKVGQSGQFGSLAIAVQACDVRPPDQPADAAAFLVVTDAHPDAPGFKGWLLKKEPEVSMLEHPIYDLRLAGCAP
jgi:hypothetical protein